MALLSRAVRLGAAFVMILATIAVLAGQVGAQSTPQAAPGTPTITKEDGKATFAFVQASSSTASVDLMVDDQPVLTSLAFGSVSQYLSVGDGKHTVKLVPAGGDASQAIVSSDLTMDSGKVYAVVAAGPSDKVELKSFEMDVDPVQDDNVRLQVVHAANGVDDIDLAPTTPSGSDPILKGISYFNASDNVNFRAGDISLEVRKSGEQGSLVTLPTLSATAGSVIDIIVTTDAQNNPVPIYLGAFAGTESQATQVATPAS